MPSILRGSLLTLAILTVLIVALHTEGHNKRVEEDQPGWNCHTMGNKVCGPNGLG